MQPSAAYQKSALSTLFVLLFVLFNANAQIKVNGRVIDSNGQPLTNANVLLLYSKDSSLVKGFITALDGRYSFDNIKSGDYIVSTTFVGFKQVYTPKFHIQNESKDVSIEAIKLSEKEVQLSAVTVSAKKPLYEQLMDRMVINVAASLTNTGSTALDVLAKSPGVIVDYQNNTITMNGKNGVVVMINGRISRMPLSSIIQMLSGMASSNIEKIELITTPPANFDAEGNAGYINIILKTNTQYGTNGSYSFMGGYGKGGLISSGSINFNHRKEKWNFYGDGSASIYNIKQRLSFYRKVVSGGNTVESDISTDRSPQITNGNGRLGLDYYASKNTIIGFLLSGSYNRWLVNSNNSSYIYKNQTLDTIINILNTESHPLYNYTSNINVQHNINTDDKVTANLDYIYTMDRNPTNYLNTFYNGEGIYLYDQQMKSNKYTPLNFWVATVDYTKKLSNKLTLEAGIKGTLSKFTNNVNVEKTIGSTWANDPSLTAIFFLKENISAAYTSFSIKMNEKNSAKVGLRYEYTNSNLNTATVKNIVDRHYGNLFPSVFFSHILNEKKSFNLSYSRRITRPSFWNLAPFVLFVDPNTFFSGNPALQPSISDALKGDYLIKKFIFSIAYTFEANPITNFTPKVDPVTNKQTLAAENQRNNKTIAITFALPFTVNKWWNMQNNIIGTWQKLNGIYKGEDFQVEQKGFNINSTQSFSLPKDFSIELRGFYQSAGVFGIYKVKAFKILDFGMQKKFGSKENLRFAISNIIGPPVFNPHADLPQRNLVVQGRLQFTNTQFKLTYTHNFGNEKVAEKRTRTTASEEEQKRLQSN